MNLLSNNIKDIQLTYTKDIFQEANRQFPYNTSQREKVIANIFKELMGNIHKLEPSIGLLFQSGSSKCFNNQSQFLRRIVIKCIWLSVIPQIRHFFELENLELMDNSSPEYIKVYKLIFDLLQRFDCYYTCLWFFFQVPNFINFNITGYRKVFECMLDYAIEKWNPSHSYKLNEYVKLVKGSTFYYNLVYHGISDKILITKWNKLLTEKLLPDLKINKKLNTQSRSRKNSSSFKKKIIFISDKLINYTSVFRDRIGIITSLNNKDFDIYIGIYKNNYINEESIKFKNKIFHPVIEHFLTKFIKNDKIVLLDKLNLENNKSKLQAMKFDLIFYPDIGMLLNQTLLAQCRLAPLQITSWGHSDTSGSNEIDYYITSKYFERCDDLSIPKNNYSEKPVLLPSIGSYYYNPILIANKFFGYNSELIEDKDNGLYAIDINKINNKKIIIGCLQSYYKFNEEFEDTIVEILRILTPHYDIELYLSNSIPFNKIHLERINNKFKEYKENIKWFSNLNQAEWLTVMSKCYIMIDPFPFGGCNTSLESFSLNIPVICFPSNTISGRFTLGFYNKMGLDCILPIATTKKNYVEFVIDLINDKGYYYKIVKEIYMNKMKLFGEEESVRDYEKIFKQLLK